MQWLVYALENTGLRESSFVTLSVFDTHCVVDDYEAPFY